VRWGHNQTIVRSPAVGVGAGSKSEQAQVVGANINCDINNVRVGSVSTAGSRRVNWPIGS
jgi:hypothetical protein